MKLYNLDYEFLGGSRHIQTESIFEFSKKLDEAIENEHLTPDSIKIYTEEK